MESNITEKSDKASYPWFRGYDMKVGRTSIFTVIELF